tara:strand:+ start:825 stop:935 length:111 start_codon:yes stop_codon:yes gene_type:complete
MDFGKNIFTPGLERETATPPYENVLAGAFAPGDQAT